MNCIYRVLLTAIDCAWKGLATSHHRGKVDRHRQFEEWLRERGALGAFEQLQRPGNCDPTELRDALASVAVAYAAETETSGSTIADFPNPTNTFDDQIGFDRKELKTVVSRMRTCAKNLKRLRIQSLVQILQDAHPPNQHAGTERSRQLRELLSNLRSLRAWHSNLPHRLNQLADAAEFAAKAVSFRGRPLYDSALASLVSYVKQRSRLWHDNEISALVGAVTGRHPDYSAEAHRRWRMTHRNLFVQRSPNTGQ